MQTNNFKPYFWQTPEWASCWQNANGTNHHLLSINTDYENVKINSLAYIYPWYLGQKFLYVPSSPLISSDLQIVSYNRIWQEFLKIIIIKAKLAGASFVKFNMDDNFASLLNLQSKKDVFTSIITSLKNLNLNYQVIYSEKTISYNINYMLKIYELTSNFSASQSDLNLELLNFYKANIEFWKNRSTNVRRNTERSLQKRFILDTNKNPENLNKFWEVFDLTKLKKGFYSQKKDYFKKILEQDFSHLLIINDLNNNPQSVWIGLKFHDYLIYMYGGNTNSGLQNQTSFLAQLYGIYLAKKLNCNWYDFGGYDKNSGYGKFKEGYKGISREFFGDFDIILKPNSTYILNTLAKTIKKAKKLI